VSPRIGSAAGRDGHAARAPGELQKQSLDAGRLDAHLRHRRIRAETFVNFCRSPSAIAKSMWSSDANHLATPIDVGGRLADGHVQCEYGLGSCHNV
jgi:hypothetical protein